MKTFALALVFLVAAQDPAPKIPAYPPPAEVRAAFVKRLERPKLAPRLSGGTIRNEGPRSSWLQVEATAAGHVEKVPMEITRPSTPGPHPVVILLHGTGGNKEGMRDWSIELAKRGIMAVAIDGRFHGERLRDLEPGLKPYHDAITKAWRAKPGDPKTYPFYLDTVWDVWRVIDYLETRDDVDPKRIGLFGISKGGIETWLAGAADERVKVAVPAISVQSFRWSLDNDQWQGRANTIKPPHEAAAKDRGESAVTRETCRAVWDKVIPGMLDQFDCPSMLRLFAGRHLLIVGGDEDPNCPLGGAMVAVASAEAAFKAADCPEKLKVDIARGVGHEITAKQRAMILDWFEKNL